MAESKEESFLEKMMDKIDGDPDSEKRQSQASPAPLKDRIFRLFGREKSVHHVLGGGKPADVFLWRDKKMSTGVLCGATAIWVLFELLEYHLLTFVCHCLVVSLAILFLWSNATRLVNKAPPRIPEFYIPEDLAVNVVLSMRFEINRALSVLRDIASGRDLRKFFSVIAGLWVLSIVGSCCNFLTLFYTVLVLLHTVPVFYDKYQDKIDFYAEKAMVEIKKQYAVFDAKVLSKIPRGPLKDKIH